MEKVNLITKKKKTINLSSIIFLVFVVLITTALYFYNNYISNEIEKTKTNISSIDSSIVEIGKNKNLQIYSLLELNKDVISKYKSMNNITKFINHMNVIQGKYGLKFYGFNLSNGEIITNVETSSDNQAIAFQKARDFIRKYRVDPKALFELGFIARVDGMDDIKFKVNFKIK